jgi:hypothetical protein
MTPFHTFTAAAVLVTFAATVFAQASAPTAGMPGAGASGPHMGMGPGMGGGMSPRAGPNLTPGWSMMTPQEREQHQKDMQSAKTPEECKAMMDKHRQQMADRAKERGMPPPGNPGSNACAGMH